MNGNNDGKGLLYFFGILAYLCFLAAIAYFLKG